MPGFIGEVGGVPLVLTALENHENMILESTQYQRHPSSYSNEFSKSITCYAQCFANISYFVVGTTYTPLTLKWVLAEKNE
jgi:hypothetical protein